MKNIIILVLVLGLLGFGLLFINALNDPTLDDFSDDIPSPTQNSSENNSDDSL